MPTVSELLSELRQRFPKAFPIDPATTMPLMLNIHKPLTEAGYSRKAISAVLGWYVNTPAYLEAVASGKPRINLDGEPVGEVSEVQRAEAKAALETPGGRKARHKLQPPAITLAGSIDQSQEPPKRKPMSQVELTAVQAKIAFTIDTATFRAVLDLDTVGAKFVPVTIAVGEKKYTAQLNPKSFRKAQTAFREAANPVVSISGNLKGNTIEAAGIQIFDKGVKSGSDT